MKICCQESYSLKTNRSLKENISVARPLFLLKTVSHQLENVKNLIRKNWLLVLAPRKEPVLVFGFPYYIVRSYSRATIYSLCRIQTSFWDIDWKTREYTQNARPQNILILATYRFPTRRRQLNLPDSWKNKCVTKWRPHLLMTWALRYMSGFGKQWYQFLIRGVVLVFPDLGQWWQTIVMKRGDDIKIMLNRITLRPRLLPRSAQRPCMHVLPLRHKMHANNSLRSIYPYREFFTCKVHMKQSTGY